MVPQGLDLPLLFFWQLEHTEPLGDPVRGDSVTLSKLDTGKVMPEHFLVEFPGEDDGVSVRASAWSGNVRTEGFQGERSP